MADRRNRVPLGTVVGIAIALFAAGAGAAWIAFHKFSPSTETTSGRADSPATQPETPITSPREKEPAKTPSLNPSTPKSQGQDTEIQVYWLKVTENKTELVSSQLIPLEKANDKRTALEMAFRDLLAGPPDAAYTTTIPQGTKLLGLQVDKKGIHVNLSQEFTSGGGSETMMGRLAQVLYTATSLEPKSPVWIAVEGKPLDVLGGEGLEVNQPLTRQEFKRDYQM